MQASSLSEKDLDVISSSTNGQIIICVDDATMSTTKSATMAHIFTVARHKRISIVLMWHVLFAGTQESRIISQNTQYYFLLASPRSQSQVSVLGSQLNMRKRIVSAYAKCLEEPWGYLMIDLNCATPDFLRLRTNVFSNRPQHVFVSSL